jgi:hypothetical protein
MQDINKIGILIVTLAALIGGSVGTHAIQAHAYSQGWYTLNDRHHCTQGDDNCFCNNPNACQIQFTNDNNTNNMILQDIIKSEGNGHFIPQNLRELFNDLQTSQQNGDFSTAFQQCLDLKQIRGLDFSCHALITQGAVNIIPGQNAEGNVITVPGNQQGPVLPGNEYGSGQEGHDSGGERY